MTLLNFLEYKSEIILSRTRLHNVNKITSKVVIGCVKRALSLNNIWISAVNSKIVLISNSMVKENRLEL